MARKLVFLVAVVGLLAMAQATPGLAATLESDLYDWVETFPVSGFNDYKPGSEGSELIGWNTWGEGGFWLIGGDYAYNPITEDYVIGSPVVVTTRDGGEGETTDGVFYNFVYTYDEPKVQYEKMFTATIPGGPSITSYDAELTITATYIFQDGGHTPWSFQHATMEGSGIDFISGEPFTLRADVYVDSGDHTLQGHFENFELTYPASTVPIPGAVWLLGTGLLGLLCLGRRRKG